MKSYVIHIRAPSGLLAIEVFEGPGDDLTFVYDSHNLTASDELVIAATHEQMYRDLRRERNLRLGT